MSFFGGKEIMRGNNLKIDINKDFLKEYKNDFYKGFSVTDIVHILAGLSVSAVVMLITVMSVSLTHLRAQEPA